MSAPHMAVVFVSGNPSVPKMSGCTRLTVMPDIATDSFCVGPRGYHPVPQALATTQVLPNTNLHHKSAAAFWGFSRGGFPENACIGGAISERNFHVIEICRRKSPQNTEKHKTKLCAEVPERPLPKDPFFQLPNKALLRVWQSDSASSRCGRHRTCWASLLEFVLFDGRFGCNRACWVPQQGGLQGATWWGEVNRSLGNGVRKNGVRNRCPYRRCGVDTEIPYRLPFWGEFCLFLPVRVAPRVDTESPYRVRIVDRGVDCRDPVCRHRFRFLESMSRTLTSDTVFPGLRYWCQGDCPPSNFGPHLRPTIARPVIRIFSVFRVFRVFVRQTSSDHHFSRRKREKIHIFRVFTWSGPNCKMRKIRPTSLIFTALGTREINGHPLPADQNPKQSKDKLRVCGHLLFPQFRGHPQILFGGGGGRGPRASTSQAGHPKSPCTSPRLRNFRS